MHVAADAGLEIRPALDEARALARDHTVVPLRHTFIADTETPVSAYLKLRGSGPSFLLESAEGGQRVGRWSFLGVQQRSVIRLDGGVLTVDGRERPFDDPYAAVTEELARYRAAPLADLPPFAGGAVGLFGYDLVRWAEPTVGTRDNDQGIPELALMVSDVLLAFDHLRHQIHIVASADVSRDSPERAYTKSLTEIARIEKKLAVGFRSAHWRKAVKRSKLKVRPQTPKKRYLDGVRQAKEYIAAGDIFQVVLSQRWDFEPEVAPFDLYRALRTVNPSPYMFFLRFGATAKQSGMHVLGSSPEMLVRVSGRKLEYRPIAGTHRRGRDEAADAALEKKMREDEKERAEHVMLVDLGRNDLGRVSEYGSVKVRDLMFVERYSHVMHLVSALEGRLRPGLDAIDAFAACFPAGTLSGAPKVRAMQIIEELEPTRRGIYGGGVLYADFAGNLDSCITIRTLVMKGKQAYLQAGGGIVADSDPQSEFEETENKAKAVLRAVEMARSGM